MNSASASGTVDGSTPRAWAVELSCSGTKHTSRRLSAIGTLLVWSATQPSLLAAGQDPRTYLKKQLLWVVIGLILMFAVSFVDSRRLRSWAPLAYGATLLGLLAAWKVFPYISDPLQTLALNLLYPGAGYH